MQNRRLIAKKLEAFRLNHRITGKGSLSVVLTLTRSAASMPFPLHPATFQTGKKGQVTGLSGGAVKAILKEYGIDRTLAEEGGRTSRGSMGLMESYVNLLNEFHDAGLLDFKEIETWWISQVKQFFAAQPIRIKPDVSKSLRCIVLALIAAAQERQRECSGTMVVGAVLEHLVGAKLSVALPKAKIHHKGFSVADASSQAKGDFLIGDTSIHVTTAPTEALARKCLSNLGEGLRPLVVTTEAGLGGMKALAESVDIADRVDVLEISQFVATNVYEWIGFANKGRTPSLEHLVATYNRIVEKCESDPSLKIALA